MSRNFYKGRRYLKRKLESQEKVDYQKIKQSLGKEIQRERFKGFWGWVKSFFVSTRAERKMILFKKMYPFVK
jgi:hypothetical protein